LNPRNIWLMVVLIVGINLAGYVAYKLFGSDAGTLLGGVLGGMVSSTATTVSFSRRTSAAAEYVPLAAVVILIATTIASIRTVVEIAVVAPSVFWHLALPLITLVVWLALISAAMYYLGRGAEARISEHSNPAELKAAILFGGLYALVVLAVAAAKDYQQYLGAAGLYTVAVLSGLHDLDAITLSTANFVELGELESDLGWRLIAIATMSNLVMKGIFVAVLGHRRLLGWVAAGFGAGFLGGIALLLLWPASL
jgi:uncharacterized membrane protein (DUF4010 family)